MPPASPSTVATWKDLYQVKLPHAARTRSPRWPVQLDHCFARIIFDHVLGESHRSARQGGRPWTQVVKSPAIKHMTEHQLRECIRVGEAVLRGEMDLSEMDARSLEVRGKAAKKKNKVMAGKDTSKKRKAAETSNNAATMPSKRRKQDRPTAAVVVDLTEENDDESAQRSQDVQTDEKARDSIHGSHEEDTHGMHRQARKNGKTKIRPASERVKREPASVSRDRLSSPDSQDNGERCKTTASQRDAEEDDEAKPSDGDVVNAFNTGAQSAAAGEDEKLLATRSNQGKKPAVGFPSRCISPPQQPPPPSAKSLIASDTSLTPFRKRVLSLICEIPRGRYTTYAQLATCLASSPRAVGNALRNNPYAGAPSAEEEEDEARPGGGGSSRWAPCHRILAADGSIGGFGGQWGAESENGRLKRRLLRDEGVRFDVKGKAIGGPYRFSKAIANRGSMEDG